uniref:Putative glucose-repressible alcohol dehydrogenase transcriptional effector ccr4 n=1 Tax=Corethrella appendiculata TaxID=1370023 RepID=U5ETA8_9DIPT
MNIVYLKQVPNEEQCHFHFRLINKSMGIDRVFNFSRNLNENINACVDRMQSNIAKEFNKKTKKRNNKKQKKIQTPSQSDGAATTSQAIEIPEISLKFLNESEEIRDQQLCDLIEDIKINSKIILEIIDEKFQINYNCPWINLIALPTSILAGFYVYPSKLELQFADKDECEFIWYSGVMPKSNNQNEIIWEQKCDKFTYSVSADDIGKHLKLKCTPKTKSGEIGPTLEVISKCTVQAGPGQCPFEIRHQFTKEKLENGNKFRVLTYNLLADLYADSDYSRKELFPYCPPYALHIDYRKQLFIKEILGYHADILCMQEVDSKIYDLDLEPLLRLKHYDGFYQQKGCTAEGIATFYDTKRFDLIDKRGINIGENISKLNIFEKLWQKLQSNQKLIERIVKRSTAVSAIVLKTKTATNDHYLIVGNTHFYYHPDADHIRLLQAGFSMLYLQSIYEEIKQRFELSEHDLSLIFCGDFNSVPECGIYKLLTEKFVDEHFVDWSSNITEAVRDVRLEQPFNIQSACGCPKYTNFTELFAACLDYIFLLFLIYLQCS